MASRDRQIDNLKRDLGRLRARVSILQGDVHRAKQNARDALDSREQRRWNALAASAQRELDRTNDDVARRAARLQELQRPS